MSQRVVASPIIRAAYPVVSSPGRDDRRWRAGKALAITSALPPDGVDSTQPQGAVYQRNSTLTLPNYLGDKTKMFKFEAHEISLKPRLVRNMFDGEGVTDVTSWTVDAGVTLTYEGEGVFKVVNFDAGVGATLAISITTPATDREFIGCAYVWSDTDTDDINLQIDVSGVGGEDIDLALTSEERPVAVGPYTPTSGTAIRFRFQQPSGTAANTFYFKHPTLIDVTGLTNKGPEIIPVDTPTGPEIYAVANALSNANNSAAATTGLTAVGLDTFASQTSVVPAGFTNALHVVTSTADGGFSEDIDDALSLVDGKRYVVGFWVRHVGTGNDWAVRHADNAALTTNTTQHLVVGQTDIAWAYHEFAFTHGDNFQYFGAKEASGDDSGGVYMTGLTVREATTGLGESNETNGNVTLGGEVHSDELHWLELDGTSGSGAKIESTALQATISGQVVHWYVRGTLDDFSDGASNTLMAQYNSSTNERAFYLYKNASDNIGAFFSDDGTYNSNNLLAGASISGLIGGRLYWFHFKLTSATSTMTFEYSADMARKYEDVATWTSLGSDVGTDTAVVDASSMITVGALQNSMTGGNQLEGKIVSAQILSEDDVALSFEAETAIDSGWTIGSGGAAQIKNNTPIPLHAFTPTRIRNYQPLQRPARYEHFPLSTTLDTRNDSHRFISSLAGATYPNGSQGVFNEAAEFANLLSPAWRLDFTNEWSQQGDGTITPVGSGDELISNGTFADGTTDGWTGADSGVSTVVDGRMRLTNSAAATGYTWTTVTLTEGDWFVLSLDHVRGVDDVLIYVGSSVGGAQMLAGQRIAATGSYSYAFKATATTGYVRVGSDDNTDGDYGDYDNISVKPYSHTTLDDTDTTSDESYWSRTLTVPLDGETWRLTADLSEGTAATSEIHLRMTGGTAAETEIRVDWANGVPTTATMTGDAGNITNLGSGIWRLVLEMANDGTHSAVSSRIYPGSDTASIRGSVNIHGDVKLQRVSAAAAPTWNTRKPGDSMSQVCLQQENLDTSPWVDGNTPTLTQDATDIFGNEDRAWTIEDNNASGHESIQQTMTIGTNLDEFIWCVPVKKKPSTTAYPGLRCSNSGTDADIVMDPVNGLVINRSGRPADEAGCIDGAIIKALWPVASNAEAYWFFWMRTTNDNAGSDIVSKIYPAYASSFSDSEATSAVDSIVVDKPFCHEGRYPFFFDSVATTAAVTEVVRDWRKIFSFVTEASSLACNAAFTHGYHLWHGMPNSIAMTNEVDTPSHIQDAESDWTLTNGGAATETDAVSVFDGEVSVLFAGDGANTHQYVQTNATLTASAETLGILVEAGASLPDVTHLGIRDNTAGGYVNKAEFTWATGAIATDASTEGSAPLQWAIPVGVGPNGGALWWLFCQGVPDNSGNQRQFWIFPVGASADHASGDSVYIHYLGHFQSDVVSLCPIIDGSTRVVETWQYDALNMSDAKGLLVADHTPVLSSGDMDISTAEGLIGSTTLLAINSAENLRSGDGTVDKGDAVAVIAQDTMRNVVRWSGNEHTIRSHMGGVDSEDAASITYDGSMNLAAINLFDSLSYELWIHWFGVWKALVDSDRSALVAEYD